MINALIVQNYVGETETILMANPRESGFAITSIGGIASGTANISTTDIASGDGAYYNSSRLQTRNITFSFVLLEKPTIEETRHKFNRVFQPKRWTRVYFITDTREEYIDGYIESCEMEIFSSQVTAQVSMLCPDPYFKDTSEQIDYFAGDVPDMEFTLELTNTYEFSHIVSYTQKNIYYTGESERGFELTIQALGNISHDISIFNVDTRESMTISYSKLVSVTGSGLVTGDQIFISTVRGEKSATLLHNGTYTRIMNCINRDADWFQLRPGDNQFTYTCTTGVQYLKFEAASRAIYNGV